MGTLSLFLEMENPMLYIVTPQKTVKTLQNLAKKRHQETGEKHIDCLEIEAKIAGYHSWHHVTKCAKRTGSKVMQINFIEECQKVLDDEFEGKQTFIGLYHNEINTTFYVFSTGEGDVWLIEPIERLALCLMWHQEPQTIFIEETGERFEIEWDGTFEIREMGLPIIGQTQPECFYVATEHPKIKTRSIFSINYPIDTIKTLVKESHSAV